MLPLGGEADTNGLGSQSSMAVTSKETATDGSRPLVNTSMTFSSEHSSPFKKRRGGEVSAKLASIVAGKSGKLEHTAITWQELKVSFF